MQSLLKVLILPEKVLSRSSYRLTTVCLTFPYIAAQMGLNGAEMGQMVQNGTGWGKNGAQWGKVGQVNIFNF